MPRGNNTVKYLRAKDRAEIARLHLEGFSQQEICDKLGKNQGNLSRTLKLMRRDLHQQSIDHMGEARSIQQARLEAILKEYWALYRAQATANPDQAMAGALRTVSELSKLLGVNTPVAQKVEATIQHVDIDPASIAAKLVAVFGDDNIVDGEVIGPAQIEHQAPGSDADVELQELPEQLDETIPDDHVTVAAEAVTVPPEAPDAHTPDDHAADAEALAEQLAARFSS